MSETDLLRNSIRTQLFNLQGLLEYLEDRSELEIRDYLYCKERLHDAVKHLKRLERVAGNDHPQFG